MTEDLWSHNVLPGMSPTAQPWRLAELLAVLAAAGFIAHRMMAATSSRPLALTRAVPWLSASFALAAFHTLWPLLTHQDLLPILPTLLVYGSAVLLRRPLHLPWRAEPLRWAGPSVLGLFALLSLADIIQTHPPWKDEAADDVALRSRVLALVPPGAYVMDAKGEAVFRPRPVRAVLETITLERYRRGLLRNDIPERLAATGTAVVIPDHVEVDERTRAFVDANYLRAGSNLMVAGRVLDVPPEGRLLFEIAVPQCYEVLAAGPVRIDDREATGPVVLATGPHEISVAAGAMPVTLVYAPARDLLRPRR